MINRNIIRYYSLIFLLASCITSKKLNKIRDDEKKIDPIVQKVQMNEIVVTPQRTDNFRTAYEKYIDIIHTELFVKFNWGKHECLGTANILLKPYFYPTDSIVLDAKSMIFEKIQVKNMQGDEILNMPVYDKKLLKLKLEKKLNPEDTVLITIQYIAKPDEVEKGKGKAIRDDKGLYFINTDNTEPYKPIQLWTQGETESNSCWFPTIDKPNEKFTSTLTIEVNKDFVTLSNGELISDTIEGNIRRSVWHNALPMPAYLTMMAVGNFSITQDSWNQKEVSYYLEPAYTAYARKIFAHTTEMLQCYSDKLGVTYPWHKYAQVVVRDFISGAMENTSATLHGEFVQKNDRELLDGNNDGIISHELFHQWFGDLVTCISWSHLVINEGFATYGEQLWLEHKYGKNTALKKCYQTIERYLQYSEKNDDGPIVNFNYKDKDDMFNTITYQKGSRVIHLLRSILGDEVFFKALNIFLTEYAYENASVDDLQRCFEKSSGKDLRNFFQQWFYKGGHPVLDIRYDYDTSKSQLIVSVEQKQNADVGVFKFPLKFKVTQNNIVRYFTFNIEKRKEQFFVQKLDENANDYPNVVVDPDATFIGAITDNKPILNHITTYHLSDSYVEKMRSLSALSKQQKIYDTARFTILAAISDTDEDIRSKALSWIDWNLPQNYTSTKDILIYLAQNDNSTEVRSKCIQILGEKKDSTLINFFIPITSDSSYRVSAAALKAVYMLEPNLALNIATTLQFDVKNELLHTVSNIFSQVGQKEILEFYNQTILKVFKRDRITLIKDYTKALTRIQDDASIDTAINTLRTRANIDQNKEIRKASIEALQNINTYRKDAMKKSTNADIIEKYKVDVPALEEEINQMNKKENEDKDEE